MAPQVLHRIVAVVAGCVLSLVCAQQRRDPAVAGLTTEQVLGLRSVTNPRLGDDFVAFRPSCRGFWRTVIVARACTLA